MGKIISIVNQKGGVGKTTTAVNLAAALSRLGKTILLVDLDPQANATSGLGVNYRELPHGIYEAMIEQKHINDVIFQTQYDGYHLAPATANLAGVSVELVEMDEREFRLERILHQVKDQFDYIFIDCPPSLGLLTVNALVASDEVLIPVQSEYYALEGLGQLLQTVQLVNQHLKPELKVRGAVITMFDKRNKLSGQVLDELNQHFPYHVYKNKIPRNVRLTEAPSHGETIFGYEPRSRGATAYEWLADEFLEMEDSEE